MYPLLSKDIHQEASEREALFSLVEAFEQKVLSFRDTYNNMCARRDEALRFVEKEAKSAMASFDQQARDEKQRKKNECDLAVRQKNGKIEAAREQQRKQDRRGEDEHDAWVRSRQAELNRQDSEDNQKDLWASSRVQRFNQCASRIRSISVSMSDRYQDAESKTQAQPCSSVREAEDRLSAENQKKMDDARAELLRLSSSLLLKLFGARKIAAACSTAAALHVNAAEAQRYLAAERRGYSQDRWSRFQTEKNRRSGELQREKNERDQKTQNEIRKLNTDIITIQQNYQASDAALTKKHQSGRAKLAAEQQREECAEAAKWVANLNQELQRFVGEMQSDFPPDKLQSLIGKAWEGQQSFAGVQQGEARRNVMIGTAYVDVTKREWYKGESGKLLYSFLTTRYPGLFYRKKANGKTAVYGNTLMLPYMLSIEKGENILLYCSQDKAEKTQELAQAIAMRMLWSIPAGQCQLLLADIEDNVSFAQLSALDPAANNRSGTETVKSILNGESVCSTAETAKQRLLDNTAGYNTSAGNLVVYQSLREYNQKNPMSQFNFLISVLQHFPRGMSETSLHSLRQMSTNCGKWGYSSIIVTTDADNAHVDPKLRPALDELYSRFVCLTAGKDNWFRVDRGRSPIEVGAAVWLFPQPDKATKERMKSDLRQEMVKAGSRSIVFENAEGVYPKLQEMFSCSAAKGIVVPVGYWQGGEPFKIVFDSGRVHTLINGATGSGKTNLLHALITNIMLYYPPEEVQMYLIDFKHGNEFERYTTSRYNLPNFRALCLCNEPEFALKMLRKLRLEQMRRSRLFKGENAESDLEAYVKKTGKRLPRIVVILDELYQLAQESKASKDQRIYTQILSLLGEFATQARAYGIHMVISGQNLSDIPELKPIKEQCATRIGLSCSDEQLSQLIDPKAPDLMRTISKEDKGACVVRPGEQQQPKIAHIVHMKPNASNDMHFRILKMIHDHYMSRKQYTEAFVMLTDASGDSSNMYQRYLAFGGDLSAVQPNSFLLGECLSEEEPNEIDLTGKNLWIAGGIAGFAENAGRSACCFALLSMVMQKLKAESRRSAPQKTQIFFFNGCADGENPVGVEDRAGELGLALSPSRVNYITGDLFREYLEKLCIEVRKRAGNSAAAKIWILIQRPEEAKTINSQVMQMLLEIMQNGPAVGVQTVIWTKNVQAAGKMQLGTLRDMEICALNMDSSHYQQVLGVKADPEPENWYMVRKGGAKIRVFDLPDKDWLARLIQRFKGSGALQA